MQVKNVFKKWSLKKDKSTKVRTETDELKEKCRKIKLEIKVTNIMDDFVKWHIESVELLTKTDTNTNPCDRSSNVRTETCELIEKCLLPVVKITKITDNFMKRHIESAGKYAMPSAEQLTKVLQMTEIYTNANEFDSEAETEVDESKVNSDDEERDAIET